MPIVLHVILFFTMSWMTELAGGEGSPSLMMIMCLWAASVLLRAATAMRMVVSKSGMSPICNWSMRFLMAALLLANARGTAQLTPAGDQV